MDQLEERFRAALPDDRREALDPGLGAALAHARDAARAAHPQLGVSAGDFAAYLAVRLDEDRPPSEDLARRRVADLYLACGCVVGDRAALDHFEAELAPHLAAVVGRIAGGPDLVDEVLQSVRERLLVGTDARGPRLGDYAGEGELLTWLRVVATRAAISELRARKRAPSGDDGLWDVASPDLDPEIALLKRRAAADIREAFHHALTELTPRQRNLLRQHLLDGLTIDELGATYGVHRVTAARWLSKARAELWSLTRRRLRARLQLTGSQIDSLLGEVRSTLDLSIERALGA